ncbi:MAG: PqqD family protein, partial [Chloroflexi bacterium]|nr:PqqD family protein [Chloroflexota bacterium]
MASQLAARGQDVDLQSFANELVTQTRGYIYIRPEDGLFILRPNRVHHLNKTAVALLSRLYKNGQVPDVDTVIREVATEYDVDEERVRSDLYKLLLSVAALLRDDVCGAPAVREIPFGTRKRELPVLSEIALTYRCQ